MTEEKIPKWPLIREQALEHIARVFGELGTGPEIIRWLQNWGVPRSLIEYPNTKWLMIFQVLAHYSYSKEKEDHDMLLKIIGEMLHPLMHGGSKEKAAEVAADFNKYLEYDGIFADYWLSTKGYVVYKEGELGEGVVDDEAWQLAHEEILEQEYYELAILTKPKNRAKISALRKSYEALISIVALFCEDPSKPTQELNDSYIRCQGFITKTVSDLGLYDSKKILRLSTYCLPFITLYNAEKHYRQNSKALTWNSIRPEMYATYSDIEELYRKANGSDVLSEPDVQKTLDEITLMVSKTREEKRVRLETQQKTKAPIPAVHKIEITKMPAMRFKKEKSGASATMPTQKDEVPRQFTIRTKDREIWVNDFLLSKPHAVSANKEFFDYVYENGGKLIARETMPDYAKEGVRGGKGFTKVINELGFKGEILKAFCPERGKTKILLRKDISTDQLQREGINIGLLLQELRTAHMKNSPT